MAQPPLKNHAPRDTNLLGCSAAENLPAKFEDDSIVVGAGLKSLFHKLETYGGQCLQIPVFTGMTGFGAALRVVGKNDVANRRAVYGPTLERGLLKQALETRPYDNVITAQLPSFTALPCLTQ